jgi:hypothetical protein
VGDALDLFNGYDKCNMRRMTTAYVGDSQNRKCDCWMRFDGKSVTTTSSLDLSRSSSSESSVFPKCNKEAPSML